MEAVRVLIIEDNPVDALSLKKALGDAKRTHFVISHVGTLADAKEYIAKSDFDVLVLDLGLPDSQGLASFTRLRELAPATPVVVLSGQDDENLATEAVVMGAQDYLSKGRWDAQIISRSLAYAIERHQILIELKRAHESTRRALEDLCEKEERLRLILTVVADGFWDWDVRTGSVNREDSWPIILGYSAGEIDPDVGAWTQLVHPKDMPHVRQAIEACLSGSPDTYENEYRMKAKSGEWKWIQDRGQIVERDQDGKALRVVGAIRDITERRLAESARREAEQRFRAIFQGAEDYIFVQDKALRYVQVNPAAEHLFGVPSSQIIGRTHEDLFGKAGAAYARDVDLRVLRGESIQEEHVLRINGTPVGLFELKVPLRNDENEIAGILTIARDITDRKRVEVQPVGESEYRSKAMRAALKNARVAAKTTSSILLMGESGSGKDYVAKYIHDHSERANGPYVAINCAAIAADLAESEFFGHEKGSFTGAVARKRGVLELAEGGTLLLNEIGEMPLPLQAKLLTFLDTRSFTRVGGEREITVNARIIAATNRDLGREVEGGRFRSDLFYRINVMSIEIPPLRERVEDIPILVQEILSLLYTELEMPLRTRVEPHIIEELKRYHWPGNVRELRNVLERALIVSRGQPINLSSIGLYPNARDVKAQTDDWSFTSSFPAEGAALRSVTETLAKAVCTEALRRSGGCKRAAARMLGISRDSLYRYMAKFTQEADR